jgi:hypothetical protein
LERFRTNSSSFSSTVTWKPEFRARRETSSLNEMEIAFILSGGEQTAGFFRKDELKMVIGRPFFPSEGNHLET